MNIKEAIAALKKQKSVTSATTDQVISPRESDAKALGVSIVGRNPDDTADETMNMSMDRFQALYQRHEFIAGAKPLARKPAA